MNIQSHASSNDNNKEIKLYFEDVMGVQVAVAAIRSSPEAAQIATRLRTLGLTHYADRFMNEAVNVPSAVRGRVKLEEYLESSIRKDLQNSIILQPNGEFPTEFQDAQALPQSIRELLEVSGTPIEGLLGEELLWRAD